MARSKRLLAHRVALSLALVALLGTSAAGIAAGRADPKATIEELIEKDNAAEVLIQICGDAAEAVGPKTKPCA